MLYDSMNKKKLTINDVYKHWISQEEVADYLWISRPTLSLYKHDKWWNKILTLLRFVDISNMIKEIKYNQLYDKIKEVQKYYPDWIEQFLYNKNRKKKKSNPPS